MREDRQHHSIWEAGSEVVQPPTKEEQEEGIMHVEDKPQRASMAADMVKAEEQ